MSEINEKQKQPTDKKRFDTSYDRIFGKKGFRDFQKGKRTHIDAQGRNHDNENFESFALSCHPTQVDWHNKHYGHLGAKWREDGTCFFKNIKAQEDTFREHRMFLKNSNSGGPGSATKHLIKTGKMTEEDMQPPKPKPRPLRKGDLSRKDAKQILERAKRGMKLTG